MATIRIITAIAAAPCVCFDLARDIDFHVKTLASTGEQAVAGRTTGLICLGEEVTWHARHLGVTQHVTARITHFDPPSYFQDVLVRSAFKSFVHDHRFRATATGTEMEDSIAFRSPFGVIGAFFDWIYLRRYIERLLGARCRQIKEEAEARARSLAEPGCNLRKTTLTPAHPPAKD